jgi:hypothetical protein
MKFYMHNNMCRYHDGCIPFYTLQLLLLLLLFCICSGSWRTEEFKPFNFNSLGLPPSGGHLHPLMKVSSAAAAVQHQQCSTSSAAAAAAMQQAATCGAMGMLQVLLSKYCLALVCTQLAHTTHT